MTKKSSPRLLRHETLEDRRLLAGLEAQDDFYTISENDLLTTTDADGTASPTDTADDGVLANDSGTDLTVVPPLTLTTQKGASVTISADGTFGYDPSGSSSLQSLRDGESDIDAFEYTITGASPSHLQVTADLLVHLDASDVTGTGTNPGNGRSLVTWSDLSGNGHDATQGIALLRPKFVTSGIGGMPSVRFEDDFMNFASPLLPADADTSVFVVFDAVPTSGELDGVLGQWQLNRPGGMYLGANQDAEGRFGVEGVFNPFFDGAGHACLQRSVDDFPYTEPSIVEVTIDPGIFNGTRVYQNGALQAGFTLSTIYTGSDTDLGSIGGGLFPFDGLISELLIYDGHLPEEDRHAVGNYLASKYGVTSMYLTSMDSATVSITVQGVSEPEDGLNATGIRTALSSIDVDSQSGSRNDGSDNVPVISELMAINDNTLPDYDDDDSDWIEVENRADIPIDLLGWYLTDDTNDLTKWRFPVSTVLEPQQRIVVFASNKDKVMPNGELHTNFQLAGAGEYLALVRPDGLTITSQFDPYPQQFRDISFGSGLFMDIPTPGMPNEAGAPAVLAAPAYSVDGGLFSDEFLLTLSADAEAEIRFTIDGSEPTESSTLYIGPIDINATTQIRARAFSTDRISSEIASEWYIKLAADLVDFEGSGQSFQSELPVMVIDTCGHEPLREGDFANSYFALFDADVGLTDAHTVDSRSAIKVRGSSTSNFNKTSFALELREDHSEDNRAIPLQGMPEEADWVLQGPFRRDRSLTRNAFIFDLSNQIGRTAMRTRVIEVFLNRDGGDLTFDDYYGVYMLTEKIKRDPGRIDVERLSSQYTTEPEITGGYIIKIDRLDPGDSGFTANDGSRWAYVEPKEVELEQRPAQHAYINGYVQDFLSAVHAPNFTHPETGQHYTEFLDLDAAIDHLLLNELALNFDSLRTSAYWSKPRDGKLTPGPIWDFDISMESDFALDDNPRTWMMDVPHPAETNRPLPPRWFWRTMYADLELRQAYIDRWTELRRAEFSDANLTATMDALAAEFGSDPPGRAEPEALARNFTRWGPRPRTGSGYNSGELDGTWRGEVNHQLAWLLERASWMDSLFVQAPTLDLPGGVIVPPQSLTITGPAGSTIYYTTDGTDPRLPGGGISATAIEYTDPIVISDTMFITARSYDATFNVPVTEFNQPVADAEAWSGITSAAYALQSQPPLRIAEVNYNPHAPTAAELAIDANLNNDDFEFIELVNIASSTIPLAGVELVQENQQGVAFDFDNSPITQLGPGERVLVVEDVAAFQLRYGDGLPVAGQWTGRLNNNGEQLTLVDNGLRLQQFAYDDQWHPTTDGDGFTLEIINVAHPNLDSWGEPGSWQPSAQLGGTPGTEGSIEPVLRGDLDRDGDVDPDDVAALVLGIQSPVTYAATYGVPPSLHGDTDQDGDLDFDDIAGFVNILEANPAANLGQLPMAEAHFNSVALVTARTSKHDTVNERTSKGRRREQLVLTAIPDNASYEDYLARDFVFARSDADERHWRFDGW